MNLKRSQFPPAKPHIALRIADGAFTVFVTVFALFAVSFITISVFGACLAILGSL